MSTLTYKKYDDLEAGHLDKMTVYQECNAGFNASPIQAKKCRLLLSKLIHLLQTGEKFPPDEATTLFFGITKLFQHKDPALRQVVYLAIKELSSTAEDVIMATSSIMKDVQLANDMIFKPNAIRALIRVIDAANVQNIDRMMKTAIVDKHAAVSSAALVSSYHLMPIAKDSVRRWANEVQEAVVSQKTYPQSTYENRYTSGISHMTQYHALDLLYHLRSHDRMALMKLIQQLSNNQSGMSLRSPNAIVMLIRYIANVIREEPSSKEQFLVYLESWLRHKSDIVNIEAAKTILSIDGLTDAEAANTIQILQVFLSSPRSVTKFAAIRLLNKFALKRPQVVAACNSEIEGLITDSSRSIATYAITTLLKTGNESSLDRLMGQIAGFMSDITDEFKSIVVDAVRSLALKFPSKQSGMLSFLAGTLRDDGGLNFKTSVIEALFDMIRFIPECKETALGHLCEFIEDCEFTELSVRILHLLGQEGPSTGNPTIYVRYIYNRVVLENAVIRAAAVTALAQFGLVEDKNIKDSIKVLLTRCLDDDTDEVRDRAALSLRLLGLSDPAVAQTFISPKSKYSLPQLEYQLALYVSNDGSDFSAPFDASNIQTITSEEALADALKKKTASTTQEERVDEKRSGKADSNDRSTTGKAGDSDLQKEMHKRAYAAALAEIPEVASYGELFKSSESVLAEDEYKVTVVKHIFKNNLVVQYKVENTVKDYVLENVQVEGAFEETDAEPLSEEVTETAIIPIDKLEPFATHSIYTLYDNASGEPFTGLFNYALQMSVKEIDPSTGEAEDDAYDDVYELSEFKVVAGDYIQPAFIGNFQHQWDEFSSAHEASGTYQLGKSTLRSIASTLAEFLSMMPLEGSDEPSSENTHTMKLCGRSIDGGKILTVIQMVNSTKSGVTIKITTRSDSERMATLVSDSIEAL